MHFALELGLAPDGLRAAVAYTRDPSAQGLGDPAYWDFVARSARGRTVAVVWNGNQHNATFLIDSDPPLQVWDDEGEHPDGISTGWVSREQIRALWRPDNDQLESRLKQLVGEAERVLVLGTPPPKPDALVSEALHREAHFVAVAAELGFRPQEAPITPARVRLALWKIVQEMLAESATSCGATFVPVPAAATDDDGLLRPVLATDDVTHTNAAYGRLMWQTVVDDLKARSQ